MLLDNVSISINIYIKSYNFSNSVLQVSDGQGKTDSKSVKISVLPDPDFLNVVEVVLNKNISHFYQKQVSGKTWIFLFWEVYETCFYRKSNNVDYNFI